MRGYRCGWTHTEHIISSRLNTSKSMKIFFLSQCRFHKCTVKVDFHCRVIFYARIEVLETFGIRQTANRKPKFAVTRLQFRVAEISSSSKAFSSVQFSSFLFTQNIIQYKNTYRNCKVAREPRRNQKAYEAWAPQSQRNKQNKMKFAEWYVEIRN